MANFTFSGVYTAIRNAVKTAYPSAYVTARLVDMPSRFPCVYVARLEKNRVNSALTLNDTDHAWEEDIQVNVFVNTETALTDANAMMNVVQGVMRGLHYRQYSETPVDNVDNYVLIDRFRRVIGGSDLM